MALKINGGVFDIAKKKSKDYFPFLIKKKACLPNYAQKLKLDFNLSNDDLRKAFLLPHSVAVSYTHLTLPTIYSV